MIYGDIFNKLFDAVEKVEQHVGLRYFTDTETVNGRLNNLENSSQQLLTTPYCQLDILITGDSFTTEFDPILIGDTWVVNNSVMITVDQGNSQNKVLHEWGDVEFIGSVGTLVGASGAYDGMVLTLTYFYSQSMLYYDIIFKDGYPEILKSGTEFFNLIIADSTLSDNQRIFIDSKGRISSFNVQDPVVGVNTFNDETTGDSYELFAENGNINWRTV